LSFVTGETGDEEFEFDFDEFDPSEWDGKVMYTERVYDLSLIDESTSISNSIIDSQ